MENKEYKISDTKNTAKWIKDSPWKHHFCSNCGFYVRIEKSTTLLPFCGKCGFKMTNPQLVKVEYDYD